MSVGETSISPVSSIFRAWDRARVVAGSTTDSGMTVWHDSQTERGESVVACGDDRAVPFAVRSRSADAEDAGGAELGASGAEVAAHGCVGAKRSGIKTTRIAANPLTG